MPNPPKQYRKKPLVVEAYQWQGDGLDMPPDGWPDWNDPTNTMFLMNSPEVLVVFTSAGAVDVTSGVFIIRDVLGGFYPCDLEVFKASYEDPVLQPPYRQIQCPHGAIPRECGVCVGAVSKVEALTGLLQQYLPTLNRTLESFAEGLLPHQEDINDLQTLVSELTNTLD